MGKKRNDFDAVGVERMTDAELSKKLGGYQRTESISISLRADHLGRGGHRPPARRGVSPKAQTP